MTDADAQAVDTRTRTSRVVVRLHPHMYMTVDTRIRALFLMYVSRVLTSFVVAPRMRMLHVVLARVVRTCAGVKQPASHVLNRKAYLRVIAHKREARFS